MEITIETSADEILGGPEWRPHLTLELTEGGDASLRTWDRHSSQNGMTFDVWHGRTLEWSASLSQGGYTMADVEKIKELAGLVKPLLERVHAGHTTHWDGSNYRGRLTEDAQEASEDIDRIFETADWHDENRQVWGASEWIAEAGYLATAHELGLTVNSDDAAWAAAEAALIEQARSDGDCLVNVDKAIERMREALQEEAEAA